MIMVAASSAHLYFPPQGPHPLEDTFGMFATCVMLKHPFNPGKNEAAVQFGKIQKTRSALSNSSNSTAAQLTDPVLVSVCVEGARGFERYQVQLQYGTPMYGLWFDRFNEGCHFQMGDDIQPDMTMGIELLLESSVKSSCSGVE